MTIENNQWDKSWLDWKKFDGGYKCSTSTLILPVRARGARTIMREIVSAVIQHISSENRNNVKHTDN